MTRGMPRANCAYPVDYLRPEYPGAGTAHYLQTVVYIGFRFLQGQGCYMALDGNAFAEIFQCRGLQLRFQLRLSDENDLEQLGPGIGVSPKPRKVLQDTGRQPLRFVYDNGHGFIRRSLGEGRS